MTQKSLNELRRGHAPESIYELRTRVMSALTFASIQSDSYKTKLYAE